MPAVDLARNTVDGVRCAPKVAELVAVLADGPVATSDVIARLYGVAEPDTASSCVRQLAFKARRMGIPVHSDRTKYFIGDLSEKELQIIEALAGLIANARRHHRRALS